jgi:hypothetical protein
MDSEIASLIGAVVGGGLLITVSLLAVAVRAGRLIEAVGRIERENRDRWGEWSRIWRDRCTAVDRRFSSLDQRLDRSRGRIGDGDD